MPITFQNITITGGLQLVSAGAAPPSGDTYWANVSLLMNTTSTNAQTNNVFLDSSTNNFTVTRNGTTTQGSITPFTVAGGSSYSTATNGGSGYFNGTTDYLTVPSNAAFAYGTGDFTWELWVYMNSTSGNRYILDHGLEGGTLTYNNGLRYYNPTTGIGSALYTTAPTLTAGTWNHIAVARQSGTTRLFLNGTLVASGTDSNNFASASVTIAQYGGGGLYYNGYISSTRIVKGTAVYTSAFTPPTTALTAISGTSLLLNFTNAGMYDAAAKNNMLSTGTAQASTTQAKWSPTSAFFNGSSSLYAQPNTAFAFGTGDFTVEGWMYFNSTSPSISGLCQSDVVGSSTSDKWWFGYSAGGLYFACHGPGTPRASIPFSPSTGTWYYVTATRASGTMRLFVDGVSGTVTNGNGGLSGVNLSQNGLTVGGISTPVYLNGYVQDLRLTKGVARYTATFTPPTAALPTF
jgi:hypothetical protein